MEYYISMDQSISIMAERDCPLMIHFYPQLHATRLQIIPQGPPFVFIIANTLVTADKHVSAKLKYNLRVIETRLGAILLSHILGLPVCDTYRKLQDEWMKKSHIMPNEEAIALKDLLSQVESHLKPIGYTLKGISDIIGLVRITVPFILF